MEWNEINVEGADPAFLCSNFFQLMAEQVTWHAPVYTELLL